MHTPAALPHFETHLGYTPSPEDIARMREAEKHIIATKAGAPFATYAAAKAARTRLGLDDTHVLTGWLMTHGGKPGDVLIERGAWERYLSTATPLNPAV